MTTHHVKPIAQVAIHVVLFIRLHYMLPSKEDQSVNFEEFFLSNCVEITEFLFCVYCNEMSDVGGGGGLQIWVID
jgi:hypothetical protein